MKPIAYYFAVLACWTIFTNHPALAEINTFTTINPMTGQVTVGTAQTMPDGSQNYSWTNSGTGETTTGFVGAPQGGTSQFSTFDSTTGRVEVGTFSTLPANNEPVRLPQPPQGGVVVPGMRR